MSRAGVSRDGPMDEVAPEEKQSQQLSPSGKGGGVAVNESVNEMTKWTGQDRSRESHLLADDCTLYNAEAL